MKRKTQKAFAGILIAGLTVGTAMTSATTASAATKKVKLSKSKVTVTEKKKATVTVKNAGKSTVKAKMANKKIATVKVSKKKLTITGKKAGKTKLTVTVKGMKKCTITVTVKKAAVQTKKPVVTTTNTNNAPKGPDMQALTRTADFEMYEDKSLGEKLTVTGKKIEDQVVVCVTNNNAVPVSVSIYGEKFKRIDSEENSYGISPLCESDYIAPGAKFYYIVSEYQEKSVWRMSLSDIKMGSISCEAADESYRSDCVKAEYSRAANGTLQVKLTENRQQSDTYLSSATGTFVFKDSSGNVIRAVKEWFSFRNHISTYGYLFDAPNSYATVECYYDLSISSVDDY